MKTLSLTRITCPESHGWFVLGLRLLKMWTIFIVFIEVFIISPLFHIWVFCPQSMMDPRPPIRDKTHTPTPKAKSQPQDHQGSPLDSDLKKKSRYWSVRYSSMSKAAHIARSSNYYNFPACCVKKVRCRSLVVETQPWSRSKLWCLWGHRLWAQHRTPLKSSKHWL